MRRYWILLMTGLMVLNLQARQTDYHKMSALVRKAAQTAASSLHRAQGKPMYITAFVQTTDAQAAALLDDYGCRKYAQWDDITIATIPLQQLEALSHHPSVLRIEASQHPQTLMDTVPHVSHLLPAYTATQQHQAYTGKGVMVGVMDVGFDLTHPNFYSDALLNGYRIHALWDQLAPNPEGSELPVGQEFWGKEAILTQQHSVDGFIQSHGTHTLGIIAGSGYTTPYRGVAFDSDICLVSNAVTSDTVFIDPSDYYKYTTATDALGFKYLFDCADKRGQPCVISFSEGYAVSQDEDDQLFAEVLSRLEGPGHIIVVSAGNENQNMNYAEKPRGQEQAGSFIRCYRPEAYYRIQADGPMQLSLLAYTGGSTPSHQLTFTSDNPQLDLEVNDTLFVMGDTCAVSISRHPSAFSDRHQVYLVLLEANKILSGIPPLALTVSGLDTQIEIYGSSSSALQNRSIDTRWNAAQPGHNILGPGCFPSVICVGSTTHRTGFANIHGVWCQATNQQKGLLMTESSTGPTMGGLMKPDVTAPGYNVISSYSSFYTGQNPQASDVTRNQVALTPVNERPYAWNANSGTSMACPVAAGTIALWLQANPKLTRQDILGVISRTANHPDPSLTYPNNQYGHGDIDAYRGLLDVLGIETAIPTLPTRHIQVTLQGRTLHIDGNPDIPVTLYNLSGHQVLNTQALGGMVELPQLPAGVYVVSIGTLGSTLIRL